jgi:large subunit ribosomal protein L21
MYAVIETGGKQYRVELGTEIEIDRLDATPGETIELGRVLLLADGGEAQIGRPVVDGATVSASVVRQDRGDKIVVFKYQPKARRRVKHGHRQDLTVVRVADIYFNGRSAAQEAEAEARDREAERKAAAEKAERKAAADKALAAKLEKEQKAAEEAKAEAEAEVAKPTRGRKKADTAKADTAKADQKAKADTAKAADAKAKADAKPKTTSTRTRAKKTTNAEPEAPPTEKDE